MRQGGVGIQRTRPVAGRRWPLAVRRYGPFAVMGRLALLEAAGCARWDSGGGCPHMNCASACRLRNLTKLILIHSAIAE
jgi:hypothetical protein